MKHSLGIKLMIALSLLGIFCSCINDEENVGKKAVAVGDRIPDFEVTMNDGSSITSTALSESVSLILFFHTSCPDCQQILPIVQQIYDRYTLLGVKFAIISREEESSSIAPYWESNGYSMPYSAQSNRAIYELFDTIRIPRVYINKQGIVYYIFTDDPVPTYEELQSALDKLLL